MRSLPSMTRMTRVRSLGLVSLPLSSDLLPPTGAEADDPDDDALPGERIFAGSNWGFSVNSSKPGRAARIAMIRWKSSSRAMKRLHMMDRNSQQHHSLINENHANGTIDRSMSRLNPAISRPRCAELCLDVQSSHPPVARKHDAPPPDSDRKHGAERSD
jgi:hypothetical protein